MRRYWPRLHRGSQGRFELHIIVLVAVAAWAYEGYDGLGRRQAGLSRTAPRGLCDAALNFMGLRVPLFAGLLGSGIRSDTVVALRAGGSGIRSVTVMRLRVGGAGIRSVTVVALGAGAGVGSAAALRLGDGPGLGPGNALERAGPIHVAAPRAALLALLLLLCVLRFRTVGALQDDTWSATGPPALLLCPVGPEIATARPHEAMAAHRQDRCCSAPAVGVVSVARLCQRRAPWAWCE